MDKVSKSRRSEIMRAVRSKDSKIEIKFRKALWQASYRYRKNANNYFGKPDIVLRKYKTVIFIDSCFWHGCSEHCRIPSSRTSYWTGKVERNKKRDAEVNEYYMTIGWTVLRIWEHDITNNSDDVLVMLVQESLGNRKSNTDIRS